MWDGLLSCWAHSFTIWVHSNLDLNRKYLFGVFLMHSNLDLNQKYLLGVFLMQLGEFHTNLGTLIDEILQFGRDYEVLGRFLAS